MRILSLIAIAIFTFISLGCAAKLQPAVQGEWSDVHSDKDKVSKNARPEGEKPAGER